MKIIRTFALMLIASLTIFLIGCNRTEKINNDAYAEKYYTLFSELETVLDEEYYHELINMLNVEAFEFEYSTEDFGRYYDNLITTVDETLYELSILGPQIDDEFLQKQQSIIEYALLDYMNTLKEFRDRKSFNVLVPIQFTVYKDMYEMFNEINPITLKLNTARYEIEAYLQNNESISSKQYHEVKQKNMYRENYLYFVFGAHVSTYQAYSGLQVHPADSNYITLGAGDKYRVAELSIGVMNLLVKNINLQIELLNMNSTTFDISNNFSDLSFVLQNYLTVYTDYFKIRVMYPHDFFKRNEFREYMMLASTSNSRQSWWGIVEIIETYDFDPIYEETHHLIEMTNNYLFLSNLIKFEDHQTNMFID